MKPFSRNFKIILSVILGTFAVFWAVAFFYLRSPVFFERGKIFESVEADPKRLESSVSYLASISPPRQYKNVDSMTKAEEFVKTEFEKLGYKVTLQDVFGDGRTFHNIIARYGDPSAKEIIVIGAHYDVCDDQPGANDNASGVAGVLELARLFKEKNPGGNVPVEFAVYSLEEPPFFGGGEMGSAVHAYELKQRGVNVKYMISLEMIGYFSDKLFSQEYFMPFLYFVYPARGDFIGLVATPADRDLVKQLKISMAANSEVPVYSINAPRILPGVDFSDHRNYWDHDWPAVMISDTAFFRNLEYHKAGDTPDRLNYTAMAEVVRGVYAAVVSSNAQ